MAYYIYEYTNVSSTLSDNCKSLKSYNKHLINMTYNHRQKVPERRRFYSLKTVFAPSTTPSIWIFTSSGESSSITKVFTQTYFNWRIFPAPLTEWQGFEVVDLGIDN